MPIEFVAWLKRLSLYLLAGLAAACFFVGWSVATIEIRSIGGPPTSAAFLMAALYFLWISDYVRYADASSFPRCLFPVAQKFLTQVLVLPVGIFIGRIVFSYLPPWEPTVGCIIGLIVAGNMLSSGTFEKFVFRRGTRFVAAPASHSETATTKPRAQAGENPPFRWAGFEHPGNTAEGNFLVIGTIGTGKTLMHRQLLASVLPHVEVGTDRRILIYDVKGDVVSHVNAMGLHCAIQILNPFDARAVRWDIARDIDEPHRAKEFAAALVPEMDESQRFFTNAARNIVDLTVNALNSRVLGRWTLRDLILITTSKDLLERLFAGTDDLKVYSEPADTRGDVVQQIGNIMIPLKPVAALWEHIENAISLRQWAAEDCSVLVLGGTLEHAESLTNINRVIFKYLSTQLLAHDETKHSRAWFFLDELSSGGKLGGLRELLNKGRSKGVRCVLGSQDLDGLYTTYGNKDQVHEMLGMCSMTSLLRLANTNAADWGTKRIGEHECFEYLVGSSSGSGGSSTSIQEHLTKREAVLPSEMLHLPLVADGRVKGFHLIPALGGVILSEQAFTFHQQKPEENFQKRTEKEEQVLRPWNREDETRLGFDDPDTQPIPFPKTPKPSEGPGMPQSPDRALDKITRIIFQKR